MPASFQVFVRNLQNTSFAIDVSLSDTIRNLKDKIQAHEGIPMTLQRLVFKGKELVNNLLVQHIQLQKSDTINLALSLKGGGNAASQCKLEKKYEYNAHKRKDSKFIASACSKGTITLFDVEKRQHITEKIHFGEGEVAALAITRNQRYIISSSFSKKKSLKFTESNLKNCVNEICQGFAATSLDITDDDRHVIVGTSSGSVKVFSLGNQKCVYTFKDLVPDAVTSVVVRRNIAICGTLTIKVVSLASRKCLRVFEEPPSNTKKLVAVSNNAKYIVQVGNNQLVRVFDVFGGKCVQTVKKADELLIQSVAITKDNKFFIILNSRSVVKFFEITSGRCVSIFNKEQSQYPDFPLMRLTPDNQYLVIADWKGDIKIFTGLEKSILREEKKEDKTPLN